MRENIIVEQQSLAQIRAAEENSMPNITCL